MGLDDLVSTQTAFAAAATAAVFSPKTRETLRRGAVLGVAGAMKAGDVVAGAARGAARGVRGEDGSSSSGAPSARGGGSKERSTRARSGSRTAASTGKTPRSTAAK